MEKNKYFAFISYKREDEEWAVWFHHELENYHLPTTLNGRTDLPKEFRPVFRDIDELKAGNLPEQIHDALATSAYLIVICSPKSAKSEWVNKEIRDFIEIGKTKGVNNVRNIFPFIVEGRPHTQNDSDECFPKVLLELSENEEIVGGNVNESGRDKAFVKVLAGMLPNVAFDDLWNRYEHDKAEEERLKREERERFLRVQSRFVAEKVIGISNDSSLAKSLALEVLPKKLDDPDRPYTVEAEKALRQVCSGHYEIMNGHTSTISALSISGDGKIMASISDDFSIRIWDTETGLVKRVLENRHPFGRCVALTRDGTTVMGAFYDRAIMVWDTETGDLLWSCDANEVFGTNYKDIYFTSLSLSQDGNRMALSTLDGTLLIMDFNSEETLSPQIKEALSVAFSPDGKKLASISYDGLIIWDLEGGNQGELNLNDGVEPENGFVTFSPDGQNVAFIIDNMIGVVDVEETGHAKTFGQSQMSYVSVSFCDAGKHLATISEDGKMLVWDIKTERAIYQADGPNGTVSFASYSENGDRVVSVVDKNTIFTGNTKSAYISTLLLEQNNVLSLTYSPDGKQIVSTTKDSFRVWCADSGELLFNLEGHSEHVLASSFSPNGKLLASASYDGTVRIWNTSDGKPIITLACHSSDGSNFAVTHVAFINNGKSVVSVLHNGEVSFWDVNSGEKRHSWRHKSDSVHNASISPDEQRIAFSTIYTHQGIYICELETGKILKTLKGHTKAINTVSFSPDGQQLLSASNDKTIICWDIEKEEKKWCLHGFSEGASSAVFSADGKYIIAASVGGDVIVCDSQTGSVVLLLCGHMDSLQSVAFSPNGKNIASASMDGVIIIWDFPPLQELIDQTRERFKDRPLTPEERRRYYLE